MTDLVKLGFSADSSGLITAQKELDKTAKAGDRLDKSVEKSSKGIGRNLGQAGIQVQQFVGQIQGGQSAMLALSQQGADLGIVLGQAGLGAAVGIAATAFSFLFMDSLKTKDALSQLKDISDALSVSLVEASDGSDLLSDKLFKLAQRSEALARLQISVSIQDAEKQLKIATKGVQDAIIETSQIGEDFITTFLRTGESIEGAAKKIDSGTSLIDKKVGAQTLSTSKLAAQVKNLSEVYGISSETALEFGIALGETRADPTAVNVQRLSNALGDASIEAGGANENLTKLGRQLLPLFDAMLDGVDKTNLLRQAWADLNGTYEESGEAQTKTREKLDQLTTSLQSQIDILRGVEGAEQAAFEASVMQRLGVEELDQKTNGLIDTLFNLQEQTKELAFEQRRLNAEFKSESDSFQDFLFSIGSADEPSEKAQKSFDTLSDSIMGIGAAWSSTGDVIIDAFGGMAAALDNYNAKMEDLDKKQIELNKAKSAGFDITQEQQKLDQLRFKTEIQGFSQAAGAASEFFGEQTAARKTLHGVEMALSAVEIAMSLKKTAISVAAGAAKFFEQSGWGGFAGVAAMGAVMAGLGFSMSGGGGGVNAASRQESQGTGTVFGDSSAKSASIGNALGLVEGIQKDQLSELRQLNTGFMTLSQAIAQVTNRLVAGVDFATGGASGATITGGAIGDLLGAQFLGLDFGSFFGSVSKKVTDSGIEFFEQSLTDIATNLTVDAATFADVRRKESALGITYSDSTKRTSEAISEELSGQFALIFSGIADTVSESASILGYDAGEAIGNFIISGFDLSLKDLSGEEIQQELNAVFGAQADLLANEVVPNLIKFQQVGEGAFETLARLAVEQERFTNSLENMGLTGVFSIETAQAITQMVGGIESLADLSSDYTDNFLSQSQRITIAQDQLNESMLDLGFSTYDLSRTGFVDLISSIDKTTESGQRLFAELLQLSPAFADLIDETESLNNERLGLTVDLLNAQGKSEQALALQRQIELEAMDESLRALQQQVWLEQDRQAAIDEANSSLGGLIDRIRGVTDQSGKSVATLGLALAAARRGDFGLAQSLDIGALTSLSSSGFSSAEEMRRQEIINTGQLNQIADLAEAQISEAEQQINLLSDINDGITQLNMNFVPSSNGANISYSNDEVMKELKETRAIFEMYLPAIAKHTKSTSDNTNKIANDIIEVEVVS